MNKPDVSTEVSKLKKQAESEQERLLRIDGLKQREALIEWIKRDKDVKIIIAFSGGKDSVYMVLFCLFELKIPNERIELWHHDVDGHGENLFDWLVTPDYCRAFAKAFNLRLYFSYRKNGIVGRLLRDNAPLEDVYYQREPDGEFYQLLSNPNKTETGGRWPQVGSDMKTRWCSGTVKIDVASRVMANDPRLQGTLENPTKIVFLTGERHDESPARKNLKEVEAYRASSQKRNVLLWRPNVEVTETQVWDMMKAHMVQPHPCYMIGWSRCSCQLCIFNAKEFWRATLDISPEKVLRIGELEEETARFPTGIHTLYDKKTIWEKVVSGGDSIINLKDPETAYWVDQATKKFTHPIIVEKWIMPSGAFNQLNCGAS